MATQYPNNLEITVEQPIDTRLSAKDSAERSSFKYLYPGLLSYLRSEKKFYYYDDGWKELSAGIKIVASTDELESNAARGSMAIVASDTEMVLYIKGTERWEKFVVDDLTIEDSNRPLSAAKGKVLSDAITAVNNTLQESYSTTEVMNGAIAASKNEITNAYTKAIEDALDEAIYTLLDTPM